MLANMSIKEFLEKTASKDPTPGGGSIAALCGAIACALSSMVAALTVNNEKYADAKGEMEGIISSAREYIDFFIKKMDADASAFEGVMKAYRLPKGNDEEKDARSEAIQESLKGAAEEPLYVAEKALLAMDMIEKAVERGNAQAVTDGAVAVMLARTAVLSALYNTEINLSSIRDDVYKQKMGATVQRLRDEALIRERHILSKVKL